MPVVFKGDPGSVKTAVVYDQFRSMKRTTPTTEAICAEIAACQQCKVLESLCIPVHVAFGKKPICVWTQTAQIVKP